VRVELNKKAKGDLAEMKVAADLRARGYKIAIPFGEDWDYDLILCRNEWSTRASSGQVRAIGQMRDRGPMLLSFPDERQGEVHEAVHSRDDDWLAVWDAALDRCFYVPAVELGAGMNHLSLRLSPSRNNQVRGIRQAERYTSI
jgi:hypothetical protein